MAKLRWYKSSAAAPATPSIRLIKVSATGAAVAAPTLRVFKVSATGTSAPVLAPMTDDTLEPMTATSLTAAPTSGSTTPDSYTWRVVSGTASLSGTGDTVTFTTPSPLPPNPSSLVIGVRASKDGYSSPEVFCTLTILPQVRWSYVGGAWVGVKAIPLS